MSKRFYIPALDGLRFVAFLLVFIHHTDYSGLPILNYVKSIGWIGVDIFFCLSAYLLTRLLRREYNETGHINIRHFFIRRILRIWPLYFTYILLCPILLWSFGIITEINWLRFIGLVTFTDNIFAAMQGYNPIRFTGHLWTISYEEQFYVLLPFVILFLSAKSVRVSKSFFISVLLIGFVVRIVFIFGHARHPAIWVLPITHFESILAGVALGYSNSNKPKFNPVVFIVILILTLVLIGVLPDTRETSFSLSLLYPCIGIFSVSALCVALYTKGWFNKLLTSKVMVYLGKISFGLYVFHNLCFAVTDQVLRKLHIHTPVMSSMVALMLTILIASMSYFLLERRFLLMKWRFTSILSRPE